MSYIPIVFSTDHRYVMPAGVAIYSLLASSRGERYDIFVLVGGDVDSDDREQLRKQVESADSGSRITFIEMYDLFANAYETRSITRASYYRLLIPWMIPQYDKIFYSDVDVIFQHGLGELWSTDIGDNYIAGVNFSTSGILLTNIKRLGLDPEKYINMGFLLINSKLFRDDNLKDTLLQHANRKYRYQDQDILNIVCKDRIAYLPPKSNCKVSRVDRFGIEECGLIHYTGLKPWVCFTCCWERWWEIYKQSIFYDSTLRGRVLSNMKTVIGRTNEEYETGFAPLVIIARKLSLKFPVINKILIKIIRLVHGEG